MNKSPVATRKDIDEIIGIVRGFMDDVHERFDQVDSRLDKIEKKAQPTNASLDTRLTKVETDTALLKKVAAL